MAIYKLFPIKDASIYSFYPFMNSGIDAVNQISKKFTPQVHIGGMAQECI